MKNEKIHSVLVALVGGYLLYVAYELYSRLRAGAGEMPEAAAIISIIVFTLGGAGAIFYAWIIYKRYTAAEAKNDEILPSGEEPGDGEKNK